MSQNPEGGIVGVCINVSEIEFAQLPETVIAIVGAAVQREIFAVITSDLIIVRDVNEFKEQRRQYADAFLVASGGIDVARALINTGELRPSDRIYWALGRSVEDTIHSIESLAIPEPMAVYGFGGSPSDSILETGLMEDTVFFDVEKFLAGVSVGLMARTRAGIKLDTAEDDLAIKHELQRIRIKHLNLLQSIGPLEMRATNTASASFTSDERLKLEDRLIELNRRYQTLERRYASLASSKLGRLTLAMWARRRRVLGNLRTKKLVSL